MASSMWQLKKQIIKHMKNLKLIVLSVLTISILASCSTKQEKMEKRLREFLTAYDAKVIPLYKESALTSWNANISGNDADLAISEKDRKSVV